MLPDWVIRHVAHAYGARMPKRPAKFVQRYQPMAGGCYGVFALPGAYVEVQEITTINNKRRVVQGNLTNEEYEFYIGTKYQDSDTATCRFCNSWLLSKKERLAHNTESKGDCNRMIKKMAALLRRDKLCVICDKNTPKTVYGFPICSVDCLAKYRFSRQPYPAFIQAKKMVVETK